MRPGERGRGVLPPVRAAGDAAEQVQGSISAFAILRASSIRYVFGQRSRWTNLGDCPIEGGERSNSRRRAGNLSRTHRGGRRRCLAYGILDTSSAWHRLARRAGRHGCNAQHRAEAQEGESPMHPIRLHRHGSSPPSGGIRPGVMLGGLSKRIPHPRPPLVVG
jgi:hypothetical protein